MTYYPHELKTSESFEDTIDFLAEYLGMKLDRLIDENPGFLGGHQPPSYTDVDEAVQTLKRVEKSIQVHNDRVKSRLEREYNK